MTTKTAQILELLGKTPGLTSHEIAEKLDINHSKTKNLMYVMRDRVIGERFEGGGLQKRYRLAAAGATQPAHGKKKPPAKRKPRGVPTPTPQPGNFGCGLTAGKGLLVVDMDGTAPMLREFSHAQTCAIAELLLQHFES